MSGVDLLVALSPPLAFLLALVALDSYKLVRVRHVVALLLAGAGLALLLLLLHQALLERAVVTSRTLMRYVAPLTEEVGKGAIIWLLLRRHRLGFLVDSAIAGFAVGAGFSVVENLYYLGALAEPSLPVLVIRGFGTAILHGGLTALVAVSARHLTDARGDVGWFVITPGLSAVAVLHSLYNHFFLSPLLSALVVAVVLPLLFAAVFQVSERATRDWLGVGFDTDSELLEQIEAGRLSSGRIGAYLAELRRRFPGEAVVDMLCVIRLHLELSIQAKGLLLAREAGFEVEPDPETEARLRELRHLERTIGRAGLLALDPIFNVSSRDLWQVFLVTGREGGRSKA